MMASVSFTNMFSSVAASTATASSRANFAMLGTALAVPFFVIASIICLIINISLDDIIISIILNALIISLCKYSCKTKQTTSA